MVRLSLILAMAAAMPCSAQTKPGTAPVEHVKPTADQAVRRAASEKYCKDRGIPVYNNPYALFTEPESKVVIRDKDAVVNRALALFYISLKGEGVEKKQLDSISKKYSIASKLSPAEKVFAAAKAPTQQQLINASWKYESLHVLLWALGFRDSLAFPDQASPVEEDVQLINELTEAQFSAKATLRSKKEILD